MINGEDTGNGEAWHAAQLSTKLLWALLVHTDPSQLSLQTCVTTVLLAELNGVWAFSTEGQYGISEEVSVVI